MFKTCKGILNLASAKWPATCIWRGWFGSGFTKKKFTVEAAPTRPAPLPRNDVHPDSQCSSNYGPGLELRCTCHFHWLCDYAFEALCIPTKDVEVWKTFWRAHLDQNLWIFWWNIGTWNKALKFHKSSNY